MCDRAAHAEQNVWSAHAQIRIAIHALLETKQSSCLGGSLPGHGFSQRPQAKKKNLYKISHKQKKTKGSLLQTALKLPLGKGSLLQTALKLPLGQGQFKGSLQ